MAKKSIINRNSKRKELYNKHKAERVALKKLIKQSRFDSSINVFKQVLLLDKLPKNSTPVRYRNRCVLTGRSRGLTSYNYFNICSFQFREKANMGFINGVKKH
ncbi:30S ribosomal protein S14 [bacterium AB1]|nr:30S ribosomal protein S14 [bacterium AB1]